LLLITIAIIIKMYRLQWHYHKNSAGAIFTVSMINVSVTQS